MTNQIESLIPVTTVVGGEAHSKNAFDSTCRFLIPVLFSAREFARVADNPLPF